MTTNLLQGKVNKEILEELYWGQGLNTRQIGEIFGVTAEAIQWQMRKYDIPMRDSHECHRGIGVGHPCYFNRKGMSNSGETRQKIAQANRGKPSSMRGRRGWSHGLTKETDHRVAGIAQKIRAKWQTEEYISRVMGGRKRRPNKLEIKLQEILNTHFPSEYKFTGDGSFLIRNMVPDFVNCNGKKEVIELFGRPFHDPERGFAPIKWWRTELGRIFAYNSFGFDCLVIWDEELKDEDALVGKITAFRNVQRKGGERWHRRATR